MVDRFYNKTAFRLHPLPSISSRGALSSNPTFVRNSSHGSRPPSFHSHYQQRHEAGDSRASSHSHHQYYDNHGANLSSKPSIHSLHAKYRHSNRREPQHSRDTSVAQEDVKELSGPWALCLTKLRRVAFFHEFHRSYIRFFQKILLDVQKPLSYPIS